VVAAVGISGPESRMKPTFMREQAPLVIQTADLISKALGYPGEAVAYRKTA
jgi:DNA-binding IclR family transcriptional regulator